MLIYAAGVRHNMEEQPEQREPMADVTNLGFSPLFKPTFQAHFLSPLFKPTTVDPFLKFKDGWSALPSCLASVTVAAYTVSLWPMSQTMPTTIDPFLRFKIGWSALPNCLASVTVTVTQCICHCHSIHSVWHLSLSQRTQCICHGQRTQCLASVTVTAYTVHLSMSLSQHTQCIMDALLPSPL